ncbi:MAG: hypothetical protein HC917_05765 [Richelia sp. SM2_1_7]|nr:hypothetical protein [Richelia sp. SM2_1_7]
MFDETSCITINFSTNNRLVKDELIDIQSNDCLINLQITKIVRKGGYLNEYNDLEEMDFTVSFAQTNRPKNTTDEVWFFCEANALKNFNQQHFTQILGKKRYQDSKTNLIVNTSFLINKKSRMKITNR